MTGGELTKGSILSIGHGTTKDGPGWRSIVYFKGCNFSCPWCSSPHTIPSKPVLLLYPSFAKYPERDARSCPKGAVRIEGGASVTDRSVCEDCVTFDCVRYCIDGSREVAGAEMTVDDVIREIMPYKRFHADYGVTISGGEPTCQPEFFIELLKGLKAAGFHTACETNGSSPRLADALPYLDLVMCDLKHLDDARHKELTGVTNETVIGNIRAIAASGKELWIRIPVVPGFNDGENLVKTAEFVASLKGNIKAELLGYHRLGLPFWEALGKKSPCEAVVPPTEAEIEATRALFRAAGVNVIET